MFSLPRARPGHPYLAGAPVFAAHRGGARLAPENTLEAFGDAVDRWGADMLELDVRLTADGAVVVIHDETVDRTTDGSGPVAALDLEALRDLDAGARFVDPEGRGSFAGRGVRVPTFAEVLESFPRTRLNVEAKCAEVAGPLVEAIRRHGAEHRVLVAAEFERNRRGARGYRGARGASRSQLRPFWVLHRVPWVGSMYTPDCDALQVPLAYRGRPVVTPRLIAEAHRRNIPVHVWVIDEPEEMRRLLALGVDAIQTDRPDRLALVLHEERGRPLPPGWSESAS
ncbi:MAG: glycerophosphodiester phosphodiesterase [Gemmatimonadetes bacterium]|nr:glycerophosphodiester phosphodiesterase [Gemmatimonadota bacterium]